MPIPQSPTSMDDFEKKAQAFVAKAKEAGKSNTAISNTLKFMYGMTQQSIENQQATEMTPYQKSGEERLNKGTWELQDTNDDGVIDTEYNATTRESKPYIASGGDLNTDDYPDKTPASTGVKNLVEQGKAFVDPNTGVGMSIDPGTWEEQYNAAPEVPMSQQIMSQNVAGGGMSTQPKPGMSLAKPYDPAKNNPFANLLSGMGSSVFQPSTNVDQGWTPYK